MIFIFDAARARNDIARDLACTVGTTGTLLLRSQHFVDRIPPRAQTLVIPEEPIFDDLISKACGLPYVVRTIPMGARHTLREIPLVF